MKNQVLAPQPRSLDSDTDGSIEAAGFAVWPTYLACDAINLDSCVPFERIAVRTRRSEYEVVVLPGSSGEVLVRGGRYFSEFRRAALAGSTFGGSAIRLRTIEVGCQLELRVEGVPIVTSTIKAVSRVKAEPDGLGAM